MVKWNDKILHMTSLQKKSDFMLEEIKILFKISNQYDTETEENVNL